MYTNPTKSDFKNYFNRDFPFTANPTDLTKVQDKDITKAFGDADAMINQDLFTSQEAYCIGYLNLAAHFMVMNLRASSQGISGQFGWLQVSKSVGSVSEGTQIPQRILDNPMFAMLAKTNYGAKYLYMIFPMLTGQIFTIAGDTIA